MKIPARPPKLSLAPFHGSMDEFMSAMAQVTVSTNEYLPWEKFRFHTPPEGITVEQWWVATAIQRQGLRRELPLLDLEGKPFHYALPDEVLRMVDRIAQRAGGLIGMAEPVTNPATRDRYIVRSLMEESITSSQLEGAATTRRVAKELLRSGRDPQNKSERMIWNNYQAMNFVRDHRDSDLTPALVRELHDLVTAGTLDDPRDGGRIQTPGDLRVHIAAPDGETLHQPPPAEELAVRLQALCAFANDTGGREGPWLQPVLRALTLHFMIGHDHYFVDGNGRLARALFYWSMLRQGLWLTEFVSISALLRNAPVKYAHSYLNTEYESDLTFFFIHHLSVLDRAFDDLEKYLERKIAELRDVKALVRDQHTEFNHRQLDLIETALSDPGVEFTMVSHATSHHVANETARRDLLDLEARGFLTRVKRGRLFVWRPAADARQALNRDDRPLTHDAQSRS